MSFDHDLSLVKHHPAIDEPVSMLCAKTQQTDRGFFNVMMAYFLGKIAGTMGAEVITKDRGSIPVNIYAIGLATSGFGKGHSVGLTEELERPFKNKLLGSTFEIIQEQSLRVHAEDAAIKNDSDIEEEYGKLVDTMNKIGPYQFTFDSGTSPAIKQMRHKILYTGIGAVNMQIDEIGSNLIGQNEILTLGLELYDQGRAKEKLIKNNSEQIRIVSIDGKTPTNMLLFGTPSKLLDGGATEQEFYNFLDTGYARRCLFGYGHTVKKADRPSAAELYKILTMPSNNEAMEKWSNRFEELADPRFHKWQINVADDVAIQLLEYKLYCEARSEEMADHEDIRKAEMIHRYFKALKLAGAMAFVDQAAELSLANLLSAIKLVEESGDCFTKILSREKPYARLAKYIATVKTPVTHADLHEALPYYKTGKGNREELMSLAMGWGYKNHIIIKKTFDEGIEFFEGETLEETNLDQMRMSYSKHYAYEYTSPEQAGEHCSFEGLGGFCQAQQENGEPYHWVNHWFKNGHRSDENTIVGFDMIVIDVDTGENLKLVHEVLKDIKFMTYTTKRHRTEGYGDRFRIVIPMKYKLELTQDEYREFMNSVMAWLPFESDEGANQRARKWETNPKAEVYYNLEGELLDVLQFIPKTTKNEEFLKESKKLESLDNLERWFAGRIASGNRNNQMVKYAFALKDGGYSLYDAAEQVKAFNNKLSNPLAETELEATVLKSLARRYSEEHA